MVGIWFPTKSDPTRFSDPLCKTKIIKKTLESGTNRSLNNGLEVSNEITLIADIQSISEVGSIKITVGWWTESKQMALSPHQLLNIQYNSIKTPPLTKKAAEHNRSGEAMPPKFFLFF